MANQATSEMRWNLFARELEDILAEHQCAIDQLNERAGIHGEKVRRLKQSLLIPKNFPILNTDEMEAISEKLHLSHTEILRLRAAVLATSIERVLMDRISPRDALVAAEQLLPLIIKAMQEQINSITGMGAIRREDTISSDYDENDLALESAIESIDKGTIALHLSYSVSSHTERIERALEARHHFEVAQVELDEVDDDIHMLTSWKYCHTEAQSRLIEANERLDDLGA